MISHGRNPTVFFCKVCLVPLFYLLWSCQNSGILVTEFCVLLDVLDEVHQPLLVQLAVLKVVLGLQHLFIFRRKSFGKRKRKKKLAWEIVVVHDWWKMFIFALFLLKIVLQTLKSFFCLFLKYFLCLTKLNKKFHVCNVCTI